MTTREDRARDVYGQLVRDHADGMFRLAVGLIGGAADAEDVVQETFLEAWRSLGSLRDSGRARAWLYTILRHQCSRYWRRQRSGVRLLQPAFDLPDARVDPGPGAVARLSDAETLRDALRRIPPYQREVIVLIYVDGLEPAGAAERLGVAHGTVLSRVHRARRSLRVALRDMEEES